MKPAKEIAAQCLESLTAINEHMGFQFTQPLVAARYRIARAVEAARAEAFEEAAGVIDSELSDIEDITDMPSTEKMIVRAWLMNALARIRARAGERNI